MPAGKLYRKTRIFKKVYSFCFGVDRYEKIDPLNGCMNDAEAMHEVLSHGKGESEYHVKRLNPDRKEILLVLSRLLNAIDNEDEGVLLIMHASAHGTLFHDEFYLLPTDTDPDNILGTGIAIYPLIKTLSAYAQKGCKVLLIFDTCNSGGVTFDISTYMGAFKGGISCIFSSIAQENSYEIKVGEQSRGLFSYFIEQGLRGYAIDYFNEVASKDKALPKGDVRLIDLYDFTYDHLRNHKDTLYTQYPLLIGTLEGDTVVHQTRE